MRRDNRRNIGHPQFVAKSGKRGGGGSEADESNGQVATLLRNGTRGEAEI
jgi:hypothetical protein